jgi:hypothetical protein
MKLFPYLLTLIIFPLLIVACTGEDSDTSGIPQGPALIMFYTDN